VEWNLAESSANLSIPVFSIPVEFWWIPEFTPECSPEWTGIVFPGMGRNGIPWHSICLFVIYYSLFICDGYSHPPSNVMPPLSVTLF